MMKNLHKKRTNIGMIGLWIIGWLAFWLLISPAQSADLIPPRLGIAAVVNDDIISSIDLEDRIRLTIHTTGRVESPETYRLIGRKVLDSLITETLKLQAAEQYSIMIGLEDIQGMMARIEQQRQKPPGSLQVFLDERSLSTPSFHQQIKADLAWQKILARKIRQEVSISDEEVERGRQRMARGRQIDEVHIASIILPVTRDEEGNSNEGEMLGIARDIRSQLLAGADAPALLKQYNQRVALDFGPLQWVAKERINPDIADTLSKLKPGDIAEPIRTPQGYHIVRLLDERTVNTVPQVNAEIALKQIVLSLHDDSVNVEIDSMMGIARNIAKYPGSCMQKGIGGLDNFDGMDISVNYIRTTLASMSPEVRRLVEPLRVTQITDPFAAPDGIHMLMLCERINMPPPLPDPDEVRQLLFQEKLELEAEKYLRSLRRNASIDIRV